MPLDCHGNELKPGDRVLVECEVADFMADRFTRLNLFVIDPKTNEKTNFQFAPDSDLVSKGYRLPTVIEK